MIFLFLIYLKGNTILLRFKLEGIHLEVCVMGVWYQDRDMISRERCSMKFYTGWVDKCALPGNRLCFALELNSCYAVTSLFSFSLSIDTHTQESKQWACTLACTKRQKLQMYLHIMSGDVLYQLQCTDALCSHCQKSNRVHDWETQTVDTSLGGKQEWRSLLRKWG